MSAIISFTGFFAIFAFVWYNTNILINMDLSALGGEYRLLEITDNLQEKQK
jgi:hypothetical protein